eukprot:14662-Heterococcus_DN1.PRE.3
MGCISTLRIAHYSRDALLSAKQCNCLEPDPQAPQLVVAMVVSQKHFRCNMSIIKKHSHVRVVPRSRHAVCTSLLLLLYWHVQQQWIRIITTTATVANSSSSSTASSNSSSSVTASAQVVQATTTGHKVSQWECKVEGYHSYEHLKADQQVLQPSGYCPMSSMCPLCSRNSMNTPGVPTVQQQQQQQQLTSACPSTQINRNNINSISQMNS